MAKKSIAVSKTGITELDKLLNGGIPKGHVVLLAGNSGTGKTVLSMQWLFTGYKQYKETGVYITLTEPLSAALRNAATLSFVDEAKIHPSKVHFIDLRSTSNLFELAGKRVTVEEINKIVDSILDLVQKTKAKRLVVDSITAIAYILHDRDLIRYFVFRLGAILSKFDCTTILTSEVTDDGVSVYGVEEFISDGIIKLARSIELTEVKRTLQIVKMRGTVFNQDLHMYRITRDGLGLFPEFLHNLEYESNRERISTGNPSLDKLLLGGIFRGSTTLVTGSTGTGKSLLSTRFLYEGALQDEPCLYIGFEESREQIIRNAGGFGWNLKEYEDKKLLTFRCAYPRRMLPEEHLNDIKQIVERLKVKRCVVDSFSALANSFSEPEFLQFAHDLNGYMKSQQVTTFFTAATGVLLGADSVSGNNISSITDNIIILRYIELQGDLKSMINILKTRGSAHNKALRQYEIKSNGIEIGQSLSGYEGIMTGVTRKVSETVDEQISAELRRLLGPVAASIFADLKRKGMNKDTIFDYIDELVGEGIVVEDDAHDFKQKVLMILENQEVPEEPPVLQNQYQQETPKKRPFFQRLFGGT